MTRTSPSPTGRARLLLTIPTALLIAGIAAFAWTAAVSAQQGQGRAKSGGMGACRTDLATFCPNTEAGGGKRVQCLAANKDKLSPACSTAIEARLTKSDAKQAAKAAAAPAQSAPPTPAGSPAQTLPPSGVAQPSAVPPAAPAPALQAAVPAGPRNAGAMAGCRADLQSLCGTVTSGGGNKMRCLRDNQAKLSPDCAAALASKKEVRQQSRGACKDDAQRLCSGAKGPERRACLLKNNAQLSPTCAGALADAAANRPAKVN